MLRSEIKYYADESMFHGFIPHVMGTRLDILMIHSNLPLLNMLWAPITDELERLDKMLNRFDATSEVSKLNAIHNKIQFLSVRNWKISYGHANILMKRLFIFSTSH